MKSPTRLAFAPRAWLLCLVALSALIVTGTFVLQSNAEMFASRSFDSPVRPTDKPNPHTQTHSHAQSDRYA